MDATTGNLTASAKITMDAPSNFTATTASGTAIDLAWNAPNVDNIDYFELDRSTDGGATWNHFINVGPSVTAYHDATRYPGGDGTYAYQLIAHRRDNDRNVDATTGYLTASAKITMDAPSNFTATTASGTAIDLAWNAPNVDNIDYFELDRSIDGGATWNHFINVGPTVTAYQDATRYPGGDGTYTYQLVAHRRDYDRNVDATTGYLTAASTIKFFKPTDFQVASAGDSEYDLSWRNNADNADYLEVRRSADGGATWSTVVNLPPSTDSYQDTNVPPGSHQYQVRAHRRDPDRGVDCVASAEGTATATAPPSLKVTDDAYVSNWASARRTGRRRTCTWRRGQTGRRRWTSPGAPRPPRT